MDDALSFFEEYVRCVLCLSSRGKLVRTKLAATNHPRIRALIDAVNETWRSHVVSYPLTKRDVDEISETGMMTNAAMHYVLDELRKSAPPHVRICALEDFVVDDFVSMARGKCERAVTEILAATHVYGTDTYDETYRAFHEKAMAYFDALASTIGDDHKRPESRSTHLANHTANVRKYVCPFLQAGHYVLIVIDFDAEIIYTYDSLRGQGTDVSPYENDALTSFVNGTHYDLIKTFEVEVVPVETQGRNECGFAVATFMLRVATNEERTYSQFKNELLKRLADVAVHVV